MVVRGEDRSQMKGHAKGEQTTSLGEGGLCGLGCSVLGCHVGQGCVVEIFQVGHVV